MADKVQVSFEETPNPQSMKFVFSQPIAEEMVQFDNGQSCQRSPLAAKIFGFPWAAGVMIGNDFVTITKLEWVEWDIIASPLADLLEEHVQNQEAVLLPEVSTDTSNDSDVVVLIKKLLNEEVRPAVAMDGGDIVFHSYEKGVVYVNMRGACSGCPGSMATLKDGVEALLKRAVPEITEVVAID